ncbi:unnamed protein product, partial [Rotaria magnacalcarata]
MDKSSSVSLSKLINMKISSPRHFSFNQSSLLMTKKYQLS